MVFNAIERSYRDGIGQAFSYFNAITYLDPVDHIISIVGVAGKIMGYFPVLGSVPGFYRILFSATALCETTNDKFKTYHIGSIVRGILEFFWVGAVCIIPDIILPLALVIRGRWMESQDLRCMRSPDPGPCPLTVSVGSAFIQGPEN